MNSRSALVRALVLLTAAAAALVVIPGSASGRSNLWTPWSQSMRIVSASAYGALTVQPSGRVTVAYNHLDANQRWDGDDAINYLVGAKTMASHNPQTPGWCLQPAVATTKADSIYVEVRPCVEEQRNQAWSLIRSAADPFTFVIMNMETGHVLAVTNVDIPNATLVTQPYLSGSVAQTFYFDTCIQCG